MFNTKFRTKSLRSLEAHVWPVYKFTSIQIKRLKVNVEVNVKVHTVHVCNVSDF